MNKDFYIIDFDSTFTQVEALDELVQIARKQDPELVKISERIHLLTDLAMTGKISFEESLKERIQLIQANKSHLNILVRYLKNRVSPSFARNINFFKSHKENIFIVSGGFKEFIFPVVKSYHILEKNIFANTFIFNTKGDIIGFDQKNPLSKEGGKVLLIKDWNLKGNLYGIGDGHSDYQLKESGLVKKFFAFTENILREKVTQKADYIVPNFDEFLFINQLPRAISYPKNRILSLFVGSFSEMETSILKNDGLSVRVKSTFEEKYWKDVGLLILDGTQVISDDILKNAVKLKVIGILNMSSILPISMVLCNQMGIVLYCLNNSRKFLKDYRDKEGIREFNMDSTREYNSESRRKILFRMLDYINKGSTIGSLNFPNIQMPGKKGVHRLLHIHHNVPGIIAKINQTMANHHLNIEAQFLKTNSDLGYVITDVNNKYDKTVLFDLKKIENTIKFRILY